LRPLAAPAPEYEHEEAPCGPTSTCPYQIIAQFAYFSERRLDRRCDWHHSNL